MVPTSAIRDVIAKKLNKRTKCEQSGKNTLILSNMVLDASARFVAPPPAKARHTEVVGDSERWLRVGLQRSPERCRSPLAGRLTPVVRRRLGC